MKLDDVLSKKKVKKIRKIPAPFDTGSVEDMKERAEKWKQAEREDKLKEIRERKRLELLKKSLEEDQKKESQQQMREVYMIWQKINFLLSICMKPDAYQRLDGFRGTNPKLYKALVRCLVEPQVIRNIDAYVDRANKHGVPEKINMKTLLWYEDRLLGRKRETKVEVIRKGEKRKKIS